MTKNVDIDSLREHAMPLAGRVSGVYLLFDRDEVVFIGEGWNCFLRAAENTGPDAAIRFDRWNFIEVTDAAERKALMRELSERHLRRRTPGHA